MTTMTMRRAAVFFAALVLAAGCKKPVPSAMELCQGLAGTKQFTGCKPSKVFEGERCPDQADFAFTTKQGQPDHGSISVCRSEEEYSAALQNMQAHDETAGRPLSERPPWHGSTTGRAIIYYGPSSETRLKPEQLNAIQVVLGAQPTHPVRSPTCDAKGKCKSSGFCSVMPSHEDNCLAGSDDDCKQSDVCAQYGQCTADANGICIK